MKKYFYFFVLLTISLSAPAQNAQDIIDTLKKDLKTNPDTKKTATIYSDLTWYYSTVSIDSALHYGKKAVVESIKLGDSTLIAQVYSDVGAAYFRKRRLPKFKTQLSQCLQNQKSKKRFCRDGESKSQFGQYL